MSGRILQFLGAAGIVGLLAGCGKTLDSGRIEAQLKRQAQTPFAHVQSVTCPSGVEINTGDTFACTIESPGGKAVRVKLKILNDGGSVRVVGKEPTG